MQHPWWFPVRELARHALANSTVLVMFAAAAVFESALMTIANRFVMSKFAFHTLTFLGYAVLVTDAIATMLFLIRNVLNTFKGAQR
jgi:hypothetical protein